MSLPYVPGFEREACAVVGLSFDRFSGFWTPTMVSGEIDSSVLANANWITRWFSRNVLRIWPGNNISHCALVVVINM